MSCTGAAIDIAVLCSRAVVIDARRLLPVLEYTREFSGTHEYLTLLEYIYFILLEYSLISISGRHSSQMSNSAADLQNNVANCCANSISKVVLRNLQRVTY